MSKTDDIKRMAGANIQESVSKGPRNPGPATDGPRKPASGERNGATLSGDVMEIEVGRIIADPDQPRREFDDDSIGRMAASLAKYGQVQPIAVRWSESSDRYIIVAGERRWRGAMKAGISSLKAVVRRGPLDGADLLALQLVENLLREDLSPLDTANAYRTLMESNNWTAAKLATELNVPPPNVTRTLALLDLPEKIQERVQLEEISSGTAYELSKIADPEVQEAVAAKVVAQEMTRDQARQEVAKVTARGGARNPGKGRGGKAKPASKAKQLKPWKYKAPNGVKILVEYPKGVGPEHGKEALVEAMSRFRSDHSEVA